MMEFHHTTQLDQGNAFSFPTVSSADTGGHLGSSNLPAFSNTPLKNHHENHSLTHQTDTTTSPRNSRFRKAINALKKNLSIYGQKQSSWL